MPIEEINATTVKFMTEFMEGYTKETGLRMSKETLIDAWEWRHRFMDKAMKWIFNEGFNDSFE